MTGEPIPQDDWLVILSSDTFSSLFSLVVIIEKKLEIKCFLFCHVLSDLHKSFDEFLK